MKNKFLIALLSLVSLTQIYNLYRSIYYIFAYWEFALVDPENAGYLVTGNFINAIFNTCVILLCAYFIICIAQKKKAEKQKAMKEKLQKQLNELEKD